MYQPTFSIYHQPQVAIPHGLREMDLYLALSPGLMLLSVFHSSRWSWYTSSTHGWQPEPQHSPGRGFSGGSGRRVRSSSSHIVSAACPSGTSLSQWPSPTLSLNVERVERLDSRWNPTDTPFCHSIVCGRSPKFKVHTLHAHQDNDHTLCKGNCAGKKSR